MKNLDVRSNSDSDVNHIAPDEKAVTALLRQPALSYTRELRQEIDRDPNFLTFHDQSVGLKVQTLLSQQGIFWDEEIFEKQYMRVVIEAVHRLRGIE